MLLPVADSPPAVLTQDQGVGVADGVLCEHLPAVLLLDELGLSVAKTGVSRVV